MRWRAGSSPAAPSSRERTDMSVLTAPAPSASLTSGKLPKWAPWGLLLVSFAIAYAVFAVANVGASLADFNIAGASVIGILLYMVLITTISSIAESRRKAIDRLMTALVSTAFLLALLPLVSLLWTVVANGLNRFDAEFFTFSMRNVVGEGGGIVHAIWGTVMITLTAAVI